MASPSWWGMAGSVPRGQPRRISMTCGVSMRLSVRRGRFVWKAA
jgi:hypothetical protein